MKTILFLILLTFSVRLYGPSEKMIYLDKPPAAKPYEAISKAVFIVECSGDTLAYNQVEKATGPYQIRPIRLNDYNRRTGKNLKLSDCYDYQISKAIFLYYAGLFGPYDTDNMIRGWNGRGPKTYEYLRKVKAKL